MDVTTILERKLRPLETKIELLDEILEWIDDLGITFKSSHAGMDFTIPSDTEIRISVNVDANSPTEALIEFYKGKDVVDALYRSINPANDITCAKETLDRPIIKAGKGYNYYGLAPGDCAKITLSLE